MSLHLSPKLHHHFRPEILTIKVIKCPPDSSPAGAINRNPNPNLKDKLSTNANPKVTTRWLNTHRLSGYFVVFTKIEHAANFWT